MAENLTPRQRQLLSAGLKSDNAETSRIANASALAGGALGAHLTKGHARLPATLLSAAVAHLGSSRMQRKALGAHNREYIHNVNSSPEFREAMREQVTPKVTFLNHGTAIRKEIRDNMKKQAELSLMEKFRASTGYKEPKTTAISDSVGFGLTAGAGAATAAGYAAKKLSEKGLHPGLASALGKYKAPIGLAVGAATGAALYKPMIDVNKHINEGITEKALSNPEFHERLKKSPQSLASHPVAHGLLASVGAGHPAAVASGYISASVSGIKSREYTKKKLKDLAAKQMEKEAALMAATKAFLPKISPTVGTRSMAAQAGAFSSAKTAVPKGNAHITKSAEASSYLRDVIKGTGHLIGDTAKSFGRSLTGEEARSIVAKHRNIPIDPKHTNIFNRVFKGDKIDDLHKMDSTAMRKAVSGTEHEAPMEKALQRQSAARVMAATAGVVSLAKLNEPKKQEQPNVYQHPTY